MNKQKILFTIGSPNQTTQMHEISKHLSDFDCCFSQHFAKHPWIMFGQKIGLMDNTIIGEKSKWRKMADEYLRKHDLQNDYRGAKFEKEYKLFIMCIDMVVPHMMRKAKSIFVQEGMIDPLRPLGKIVRFFRMPAYYAFDTSLNGYSNIPDIYCVASEGYREHFIKMGVHPGKIIVTGIPNFDNAVSFLKNDFPHKDYVMVATSDIREVFRNEDRIGFIKRCVKIANGRPMLFKLHPNEMRERAEKEIRKNAPEGTLIFQDGNTNAMIANCTELITQYSTVVYVGMALGKKVHSFFDNDYLQRMTPIQNGGKSAERIADIARGFVDFKGSGIDFLKQYKADWLEGSNRNTSAKRVFEAA